MGEPRPSVFGEKTSTISLMVLGAQTPAALRRDTLTPRGRTRVFMSRKALEQRYGRAARGGADLQHRPTCPSWTDEPPLLG